jgi:hypothetical protein
MKTFRALALLLLLPALVRAQQAPQVNTSRIGFAVYTLNAAPVPGATLAIVGVPGQTTYCYHAIANFPIGSVYSFLGCVTNAPNTLSGSNYVQVTPWTYPPSVTNVDILRTTSILAPTGACNCAVVTGLTSGGTNDQSNSLSSYTVSLINISSFSLYLTNEAVGSGATHLMLRNAAGTLVQDLSLSAGGITGGGTAGTIPEFTSGTALGNSPIVDAGASGITITEPSTANFIVSTGASLGGGLQVSGTGTGQAKGYIGSAPLATFGSNPSSNAYGGCSFNASANGSAVCLAQASTGAFSKMVLSSSGAQTAGNPSFSLSDFTGNAINGIESGNGSAAPGIDYLAAASQFHTFYVNGVSEFQIDGNGIANATGGFQQNGTALARNCGQTTSCANTAAPAVRIIYGSAPLVSGTPSVATVTGISPVFTSTTSFQCSADNATTQANSIKVVNTSTSSITLTGPNTVSDTIAYICVGT